MWPALCLCVSAVQASQSECRIVIAELFNYSFVFEKAKENSVRRRDRDTVYHPAPFSSASPPTHLHGRKLPQTHSLVHTSTRRPPARPPSLRSL